MSELRSTALHERHAALGASFTDFGGWSMPVRYSSDLAEHHAVRTAAGLFDISHMAEFVIEGADAGAFLDYALAGRFSAMPVWKAKYSLLLADTGGIIDDVIVYRLGDARFLIISNAGNRDAVAPALTERAEGFGALEVTDVTDDYALIAVQGPSARAILDAADGIADLGAPLDDLKYYAAIDASFATATLLIARTGYTGEDGYELLVPNAQADALWAALTVAGEPLGLVPAGL
ncbi:MAG: glycine cleavage system protein T, partial [Microbacterium sp.]